MKKANWTEVKPTNVLVKTTVKYVATWVIDFNIYIYIYKKGT